MCPTVQINAFAFIFFQTSFVIALQADALLSELSGNIQVFYGKPEKTNHQNKERIYDYEKTTALIAVGCDSYPNSPRYDNVFLRFPVKQVRVQATVAYRDHSVRLEREFLWKKVAFLRSTKYILT